MTAPHHRAMCASARRVLHVRSLSQWAPVCIGPYSQGVATRGVIRLAGQIGLVPHVMQLVCNLARTPLSAPHSPDTLARLPVDGMLSCGKLWLTCGRFWR